MHKEKSNKPKKVEEKIENVIQDTSLKIKENVPEKFSEIMKKWNADWERDRIW